MYNIEFNEYEEQLIKKTAAKFEIDPKKLILLAVLAAGMQKKTKKEKKD